MKTSKKAGENPPEFSQFQASDICAIIKECGLSGVRRFSYLGLELRYGPLPLAQAIEPIHVPDTLQQAANSQARESFQMSEQEIKDNYIQNLLVTDPVEYERLLREEELIDDGDADGNDENLE